MTTAFLDPDETALEFYLREHCMVGSEDRVLERAEHARQQFALFKSWKKSSRSEISFGDWMKHNQLDAGFPKIDVSPKPAKRMDDSDEDFNRPALSPGKKLDNRGPDDPFSSPGEIYGGRR